MAKGVEVKVESTISMCWGLMSRWLKAEGKATKQWLANSALRSAAWYTTREIERAFRYNETPNWSVIQMKTDEALGRQKPPRRIPGVARHRLDQVTLQRGGYEDELGNFQFDDAED